MQLAPLTAGLPDNDELRSVLVIHTAEPDGLCHGCLDQARLALSPCPYTVAAIHRHAMMERTADGSRAADPKHSAA